MATRDLGWLDTNIFIHALFQNDPFYRRCIAILAGLETGEMTACIDPLVVHELTYVLLKRIPSFHTRADAQRYIRSFLVLDSVHVDHKDVLLSALGRWVDSQRMSFTDAWLAQLSQARGMPVCSVNRGDFEFVVHNTLLQLERELDTGQ